MELKSDSNAPHQAYTSESKPLLNVLDEVDIQPSDSDLESLENYLSAETGNPSNRNSPSNSFRKYSLRGHNQEVEKRHTLQRRAIFGLEVFCVISLFVVVCYGAPYLCSHGLYQLWGWGAASESIVVAPQVLDAATSSVPEGTEVSAAAASASITGESTTATRAADGLQQAAIQDAMRHLWKGYKEFMPWDAGSQIKKTS